MIDTAKYETLLADYQVFETEYWSAAFTEEKEKLLPLLGSYQVFDKYVLSEIVKTESPQYNIFKVLNVRHYEEKLHTPFLVNLLNPKGSHGQGALFLDLFFELVLKLEYRYKTITTFNIKEERKIDSGRIDILMTFHNGKNWVGIVIENKIYAKDQYRQLKKYHDYLESRFRKVENRKLYYLTPRKINPTTHSISEKDAKELRDNGVLHNLGYHADIYPWLKQSLSKIQSPKIRFTIEQYLKTITTL
ncbi:MAG: PD-(D/E)XK nuclease family protein [Saprospiraceae bacterium]